MTYVCFSVSFSNLLVCTICIYSNWSLGLVKNVILPEKLKLLYQKKSLLQKSSNFLVFLVYSLLFVFCRFSVQKTIKIAQPVQNLQNIWS